MNLREPGSGFGLARGIYHAGRSDDLRQVVAWLAGGPLARRSPWSGFSLGANLVLKLAAEAADGPLARPRLRAGGQPADRPGRLLRGRCRGRRTGSTTGTSSAGSAARWAGCTASSPSWADPGLRRVSSVYEFDDRYTAARNGFASADDYYARSSSLFAISPDRAPGPGGPCRRRSVHPRRAFPACSFPGNLASS